MIVCLISIVLLAIAILCRVKSTTYKSKTLSTVAVIFTSMFFGGLLVTLALVYGQASYSSEQIRIYRASLIERYNAADSEYIDCSKCGIIKNITEYNMDVSSIKHLNESKVTNWLFPDEYVDSLEYIEINTLK